MLALRSTPTLRLTAVGRITRTRRQLAPLASLSTTDAAPAAPVEIFRRDYKPPPFLIPEIKLYFNLHEKSAVVKAALSVQRMCDTSDLQLDGEDLVLKAISIDGVALELGKDFSIDGDVMTIPRGNLPATPEFQLETTVEIKPQENLQLSGLYKSSGMFCTQCEALGFRRITFNMDRPDVLSRYSVTMEADRDKVRRAAAS